MPMIPMYMYCRCKEVQTCVSLWIKYSAVLISTQVTKRILQNLDDIAVVSEILMATGVHTKPTQCLTAIHDQPMNG